MKNLIFHWTAGAYTPSRKDLTAYHYLVNETGSVTPGRYTPEDNKNCADGKYAAHVALFNTNSIGVAFCGMAGFSKWRDANAAKPTTTRYPLTQRQCEAGFHLAAKLCEKYGIALENVYTHWEVENILKIPQGGKIDITWLPPEYKTYGGVECGDLIRNKIKWYQENK